MKLITAFAKPKIGYPISIGVVLAAIAFILSGYFAIGCIVGGFGIGLMIHVAQTNGQYPTGKPLETKRDEQPLFDRQRVARVLTLLGLIFFVVVRLSSSGDH